MRKKLGYYFRTVRYLKPEQLLRRVGKKLGFSCSLRGTAPSRGEGRFLLSLPELDFDPGFLRRFSPEELMEDRITLLHENEVFRRGGCWYVPGRSELWNFNLHYFEFLHVLTRRYLDAADRAALEKAVQLVRDWIRDNPRTAGGPGWSPYTISLRLTNWLAWLAAVDRELEGNFRQELEEALFAQYVHLSRHLERDLLGNHYFENLKALVLCALYFQDGKNLPLYLEAFRKECREEILPDGMHFELSPMYHKLVLEGLLRVASALREAGQPDGALELQAARMLNAAWSMENGLHRTPLFNDSGDNVAKSLTALTVCAKKRLGIEPVCASMLPDSGYYFFNAGPWRLIVDAGAPGPDYIPGHSHCDAMSFELFRGGEPVLVNSGTYGYQCSQRHWFRSTRAHNTVQVMGVEQSEIWSVFRLARRSRTRVLEVLENGIRMEMTDYRGNRIRREILLTEQTLSIRDRAEGLALESHLHSIPALTIIGNVPLRQEECPYGPEYGLLQTIHHYIAAGTGQIELTVPLAAGGDPG